MWKKGFLLLPSERLVLRVLAVYPADLSATALISPIAVRKKMQPLSSSWSFIYTSISLFLIPQMQSTDIPAEGSQPRKYRRAPRRYL